MDYPYQVERRQCIRHKTNTVVYARVNDRLIKMTAIDLSARGSRIKSPVRVNITGIIDVVFVITLQNVRKIHRRKVTVIHKLNAHTFGVKFEPIA